MQDYQVCHIRLPFKTYKKIKILAIKQKKTIGNIIDDLLQNSLNKAKKPTKLKSKR